VSFICAFSFGVIAGGLATILAVAVVGRRLHTLIVARYSD
jgi:hypothetical protein